MSFKLEAAAATLGVQKKSPKMQFVLTGFKQDLAFRVFTFEANTVDGSRAQFSVRADLAMARKYGIQMQALPLLCWGMLERCEDTAERSFIYSEDEMCLHARACKEERAAAILKKQSARRSLTTTQPGVGWRTATVPQTNG